jgi:hypothetical protein
MVRRTSAMVAVLACLMVAAACTQSPAGPAPTSPATQPPRTPLEIVRPATTATADPETGYTAPAVLLTRPLTLPPPATDGGCPVDVPHPAPVADVGDVSGPGPAYPGSLTAAGVLEIASPGVPGSAFTGEYGGQKIGWLIDPTRYTGPVLIRGVRLDGTDHDSVRFWGGSHPPDAMQLPPGASNSSIPGLDWTFWPSYTRVKAPGCYAWQVDGLDFSYHVTFRAVWGS